MSFLSILIHRVNSRLEEAYGGDAKRAVTDWRFRQAVDDLKKYMDDNDDFKKKEAKEANKLYAKHMRQINKYLKTKQ